MNGYQGIQTLCAEREIQILKVVISGLDDLTSVDKMMHFPGFYMFSLAMLLLLILK